MLCTGDMCKLSAVIGSLDCLSVVIGQIDYFLNNYWFRHPKTTRLSPISMHDPVYGFSLQDLYRKFI